jgi:hypothetical protein
MRIAVGTRRDAYGNTYFIRRRISCVPEKVLFLPYYTVFSLAPLGYVPSSFIQIKYSDFSPSAL